MKHTYTIGIDPGLTGAWVLLKNGRFDKSGKNRSVNNVIDFWYLYAEIHPLDFLKPKVYIEKPFAPALQQGTEAIWRNYQSLYLAFTFTADQKHLDLKPNEINPKEWQKVLGFDKIDKNIKGKERKRLIKERAFKFAKQQEPKINWYNIGKKGQTLTTINDGLVDAYCIAYAGYLLENIKNDN